MEPNIEEFLFSTSQRFATKFFRTTAEEIDHYWKLSPIEQKVFIVLKLCIQAMERRRPYCWKHDLQSKSVQSNLFKITPHASVAGFEVDFLVEPADGFQEKGSRCVVECDSQQWHERTAEERAFEKRRDRILQCQGLLVFRYTGKEIHAQPFHVTSDIITRVGMVCPVSEAEVARCQQAILKRLEYEQSAEVPPLLE